MNTTIEKKEIRKRLKYDSIKQAAVKLGLKAVTVRKMVLEDVFPSAQKIGSFWVIPWDEIEVERERRDKKKKLVESGKLVRKVVWMDTENNRIEQ